MRRFALLGLALVSVTGCDSDSGPGEAPPPTKAVTAKALEEMPIEAHSTAATANERGRAMHEMYRRRYQPR